MLRLLDARIKDAEKLKDPAHVRSATLGLYRIIMQHACVTLGEWLSSHLREHPDQLARYSPVDVSAFTAPSDGALIDLLSQLLVAAENLDWRSAGRPFWMQQKLPPELRSLATAASANLETVLRAFVRSRNDGAEGHGLPGDYTPEADIAVLRALLQGVERLIPVANKETGQLSLPEIDGKPPVGLATLKLSDGHPICYRRLSRVSAGRLLVDAQVQKTSLTRGEISFEVPNILLDLPKAAVPEYAFCQPTWSDSWRPLVYIPDRLATEKVFTGRAKELSSLAQWMDDSDSRKCMVWGDGGVGKTTLVVEFLHRLLDGSTPVQWRPEIITFYTAKKTRWGIDGLEHISAQDIGVADVALDIARMLTTPALDRSWFGKEPKEVIQKLGGLLAEMKVSRDQHLIILDNTETMARSTADIESLASQINELSRRVGKVVLTSRRREQIEALPIQIEGWSDDEGAEFLKKRAEMLRCNSILQAGIPTLKKYSGQLVNKPIALEVFAQAAAGVGVGLEAAFTRVQRMQRRDLGQFLYDDAWARLAPSLRRVLLLMSRIADTLDQFLMQLCCQRAEVSVSAASEAIEESRGIGVVSRTAGALYFSFNPEFHNYCVERSEMIGGVSTPTDEDVEWVRRRYTEFIKSANVKVKDRNFKAFRVPAARAAWKWFTDGDPVRALEYYELAELEDPENGWLFDRYAYCLMRMRRFEDAMLKASRAVQLEPSDPEVHFTKGMIHSRAGQTDESISELNLAAKHGKPKHLCEMQKAYAYVYAAKPDFATARVAVEAARRSAPKDSFQNKFLSELTRFERRWLPEEARY
ncbi:hypothetical protein C7444_1013 [Sphaerotilus hippei]|uniref:Uncharacterized protein n=1 Tax=Sphaerotilus hippei TaxID=744406 RepID=A0A318H5C7_9BURK|nr:hypothetical protein [Sphaerotilus hippei]PXW99175.1 hypothetical protein C7444_1013 [Sphaerotilus hippei]